MTVTTAENVQNNLETAKKNQQKNKKTKKSCNIILKTEDFTEKINVS